MSKLRLKRLDLAGLPADVAKCYTYKDGAYHLDLEGEDPPALQNRLSKAEKLLAESMVEARAGDALEAAGGNRRLLLPHLTARAKVKFQDGSYRLIVTDEKGTELVGSTLADVVGELQRSDALAAAFTSTPAGDGEKSGGGARGISIGKDSVQIGYTDAKNPALYRKAAAVAKEKGLPLRMTGAPATGASTA